MSTNRAMRRKERAITEPAAIKAIVEEMEVIRLGFYDGEEVYIVPMNFGFTEEEGAYTFYMHSAKKGRKVDLIGSCGKCGFELDKAIEVVSDDVACDHTQTYHSIIGHGAIEEITDLEEKKAGLQAIMLHCTGKGDWELPDKMVAGTLVVRLTPDWMTCKANQ